MTDDLEQLWADLLSQERPRIRRAWEGLTDEEALAVLAHLEAMRDDEGWSQAQRESAAVALRVVRDEAS